MNGVRTTTVLGLTTILVACAGVRLPRNVVVDVPNADGGGVTTALTSRDTATFEITIDPWRATTYDLGAGNAIVFPAGSVCDPDKSSYGTSEWDKPCVAARRAVTVHVKAWLDTAGHPSIDFSPNIRFVPSVLPNGWVNLTFADARASLDPALDILSCGNEGRPCADEASADTTLLTRRDAVSGQVTRRVKHFSGYTVGARTTTR